MRIEMPDQPDTPAPAPQTGQMPHYEFHPYANRFTLITEEQSEALVANIKGNGLREAIVLHEGKILDGRNRYNACREAGIIPTFRVFDRIKEGSPEAFVILKNVQRRHLTTDDKKEFA